MKKCLTPQIFLNFNFDVSNQGNLNSKDNAVKQIMFLFAEGNLIK